MLDKELVWLTFRFLHCYFINIDLFFCLSIHILIYLLLSFLLHVSFQLFIHLHIVTFYLYFLINNLVIYLFICLSNFWCLFLVLLFQVVLCVYRLFICTLNYFYFSKESILCLPVFTLLCLFLWIGKKIMMPYINRCPNYLHLLIWSMQTCIKTWWTLKCSHHTPIFNDFNWPHLFWVFPVFTANEKVWFPGEAIHGRNICSDYKCSLRLYVWLYSQQLPSFYSKYCFITFFILLW